MEKKSFCRVMPPHWLGMVDALGTVPWAHIVNPALHSLVYALTTGPPAPPRIDYS